MEKPVIEYPCTWSYRAIGTDKNVMMAEIPLKLGSIPYSITQGNTSRAGNYCSLNIDAIVQSESERLSITPMLRSIPGVKMVL
ncbi:MAG: DUF493 domain-containing protein [Chitinispirillaceae bacterium]|nr:DUF493 domain-containing protein [Chitinispirillaceae bacterium]